MDNLGNIMIGTIQAKSGGDAEKEVDPQYWKQGFNALSSLFCSSTSVSTITYSDKKVSQDIIKEVMKIAFDVNGMPEGKLKSDITSWLQQQAGLMDQLTFNDAHLTAPYSILDFVNFVKDGVHTCGFRVYFTEYNTDTVKISRSCRSPEKKFDFNLKVTCYTSGFMLSAWENDEAFRKRVTDLIVAHQPGEDFFDELSTKGQFNVA